MSAVQIHPSWKPYLETEFAQEYFQSLTSFIRDEYKSKTIYPPGKLIFNAFNLTPFEKVKVVILGQDPYHGPNQAHGLAFSVLSPTPPPPSLKNIYKEITSDLGQASITNGDLTQWAEQGVFLLNSVLTVEGGKAASHATKGWEKFTDRVISILSESKENLVFILWGGYAQKKAGLIDATKHLIIKSAHPSPLSAHNGFWGSKPFGKTNEYLESIKQSPIQW